MIYVRLLIVGQSCSLLRWFLVGVALANWYARGIVGRLDDVDTVVIVVVVTGSLSF